MEMELSLFLAPSCLKIVGNLAHFQSRKYRLCRKAELIASRMSNLPNLLEMHSTLPLVTAYVLFYSINTYKLTAHRVLFMSDKIRRQAD